MAIKLFFLKGFMFSFMFRDDILTQLKYDWFSTG